MAQERSRPVMEVKASEEFKCFTFGIKLLSLATETYNKGVGQGIMSLSRAF